MVQKRLIKRLETSALRPLWNLFPVAPNVLFYRRNNEPS